MSDKKTLSSQPSELSELNVRIIFNATIEQCSCRKGFTTQIITIKSDSTNR